MPERAQELVITNPAQPQVCVIAPAMSATVAQALSAQEPTAITVNISPAQA